ncbi:MAG: Mut7-C RNAse domain-containing protein [Gemmatimonadota bacterium]
MAEYRVQVRPDPALWVFLAPRHRRHRFMLPYDGTSSLGHLVESAGIPLPEVGALRIGGRAATAAERVPRGRSVTVLPVTRPQPLPPGPPRFCLDVHLGTLARRLRLLGLDTWYRNDAGDDELIEVAAAGGRVLLTRDRGLLRRRAVRLGAYVYGDRPDDQLADVLDRFAPPIAPWTRCPASNGLLAPAAKGDVEHLLEPGTRRTYQEFARCRHCGRAYWHGAHSRQLAAMVARAREAVAGRAGNRPA